MSIARINLYIQSLVHVLIISKVIDITEVISLSGFYIWLGYLVSYLPNNYSKFMFLMLSHNIAGILHVQITLSHYPMTTYHGYKNFIDTQLEGTLNIDSNKWTDWFHGGLQYQIEHHLFPRLPRHNLSKVKKYVVEFCKKNNLPYRSVSFIGANRMIIRELKRVASEVNNLDPIIFNGMNLIG